MCSCFHDFLVSESGAVTVDWVVLTAALTGLGIGTTTLVRNGTADLGNDVSTALIGAQVATLGCLGANNGPAGFECYTGPLILERTNVEIRAVGGGCSSDSEGNVTCGQPAMWMSEDFRMSDGQTFTKRTVIQNGTRVETWTDADGIPVDAPPPMA